MKVMHLISTNVYSGAENVACQIILGFKGNKNYDMVYCSESGSNEQILKEKQVKHLIIKKFNYKCISEAVRQYKPDIIHAHDIKASIYAAMFSNRCKIISHIHSNHENMRKLNLKTSLFNFFSKRFSKIIWVSDSALNNYYFRSRILNKSIVLYNVINPKEVYNKSRLVKLDKKYDVIYVGRLTYQKNPERLIEVISLLKEKIPNISFGIVGNGDMFDIVKDLISKKGLNNNIELLGYKNNSACYIKNSKIMLMTSRYEGTPMCALEAIALGKPIVSTPTDGLTKIIKNGYNGFLAESNEQLSEKACLLLKDNNVYSKIEKNVKESNYKINDYTKYISIIEEIYRNDKG